MTSASVVDPVPYELPVRVYFQDTDAGGVVFHATYLNFMERARTEWLRDLGLDLSQWSVAHACLLVVRRLQVAYRGPARLDELLHVSAELVEQGRAQFTLSQRVRRGTHSLVEATVNLACVRQSDLYPVALPDSLRSRLPRLRADNK